MININKLKNKKNGSMLILLLAVIMLMAFPMLAVMYDLSMYNIAKQDVRNLQDLAGVACRSEYDDKFKNSCRAVVDDVMMHNTGMPSGNLKGFDVIKSRRESTHFRTCGQSKGTQGMNAQINTDGNHGFTVKITNACYYPVFAIDSIFRAYDNSNNESFRKEIPINVNSSHFKASYKK